MERIRCSLRPYRNEGAVIFSGRQEGAKARTELEFDSKDKDDESYEIEIPEDTVSINSSFFGGLFEESVIILKREGFLSKYRFILDNGKDISDLIRDDIEEGIRDALQEF